MHMRSGRTVNLLEGFGRTFAFLVCRQIVSLLSILSTLAHLFISCVYVHIVNSFIIIRAQLFYFSLKALVNQWFVAGLTQLLLFGF